MTIMVSLFLFVVVTGLQEGFSTISVRLWAVWTIRVCLNIHQECKFCIIDLNYPSIWSVSSFQHYKWMNSVMIDYTSYQSWNSMLINSFLNNKFSTLPNLKSLKKTILNFMKKVESFFKRVENTVKRRNRLLRRISPFPTVFSKDLSCRHVKTRACLGRG